MDDRDGLQLVRDAGKREGIIEFGVRVAQRLEEEQRFQGSVGGGVARHGRRERRGGRAVVDVGSHGGRMGQNVGLLQHDEIVYLSVADVHLIHSRWRAPAILMPTNLVAAKEYGLQRDGPRT